MTPSPKELAARGPMIALNARVDQVEASGDVAQAFADMVTYARKRTNRDEHTLRVLRREFYRCVLEAADALEAAPATPAECSTLDHRWISNLPYATCLCGEFRRADSATPAPAPTLTGKPFGNKCKHCGKRAGEHQDGSAAPLNACYVGADTVFELPTAEPLPVPFFQPYEVEVLTDAAEHCRDWGFPALSDSLMLLSLRAAPPAPPAAPTGAAA